MNDIKDFRIGKAFYLLENNKGSRLRLNLNYGTNKYSFRVLVDKGNTIKLKKQAEVAAKHMLGKKAQKNLSYKLLELKLT